MFSVDRRTGEVRVARPIDRETSSGEIRLAVTIEDEVGGGEDEEEEEDEVTQTGSPNVVRVPISVIVLVRV